MVPGTDDDFDSDATSDDDTPKTDGGANVGFDEAALYGVVRKAVEDAILGAIGTVLLVGVAFVVVATGASIATQAASQLAMALGVVAVLFGLYLAAATLRIIPPAREWF